jgi:uncharacterized protein DUF1353
LYRATSFSSISSFSGEKARTISSEPAAGVGAVVVAAGGDVSLPSSPPLMAYAAATVMATNAIAMKKRPFTGYRRGRLVSGRGLTIGISRILRARRFPCPPGSLLTRGERWSNHQAGVHSETGRARRSQMPFTNLEGNGPARVVLEQFDAAHFKVLVGFKYVDPTTNKPYPVRPSNPKDPKDVTDLASVPSMFLWLVASYGQHTAAALLHDRLVADEKSLEERIEADTVFFHALEDDRKNWMRHRLMWAAVSVGGTMWKYTKLLALLFFTHVLAFWVAVLWSVGALAWLARQPWLDWLPYIDRLPFEDYRLWMAIGAGALFVIGFFWRAGPTADPNLAWWMWLVTTVGVALIVGPSLLIALSVRVVQLIDRAVARLRWIARQGYEPPAPLKPEPAQAAVPLTPQPAPPSP